MRRASLLFGAVLLIGFGADRGAATSPCGREDEQTYQQKADLPRGAAAATGVGMAEKGQPYQMGDVILEKGLPLYRFVSATRSRCQIKITYEQGGFLHRWGTFSLSRVNGAWRLVKQG